MALTTCWVKSGLWSESMVKCRRLRSVGRVIRRAGEMSLGVLRMAEEMFIGVVSFEKASDGWCRRWLMSEWLLMRGGEEH
jgi:hypothetical protein